MTRVGLHVGQLRQPVPGGIGTYVRALLTHLPRHEVALTPFAAGATDDPALPHCTNLGFPTDALRYELWMRARRPRLALEVDVVHGPSLAIPPARLRNGRRAALVVTVHDVAFLRYPQFFTRRGVEFHTRGLDLARREADLIITPSEFTRQELGREGVDITRVIAIPHGITTPAPPDADVIAARLAALGVRTPFVLGVGTIEPRKGFDIVARAMEKLAPEGITFVIAGPEGWHTVPGLDHPAIIRLGAIPADDLDVLYRTALACAVPSHYEGFGLPALEAMARGCPVITSDAQSLTEVVADAGVLVPVGEPAAWADAIRSLADDPARRDTLRSAGLARARAFQWTTAARAHADAYLRAYGRREQGTT